MGSISTACVARADSGWWKHFFADFAAPPLPLPLRSLAARLAPDISLSPARRMELGSKYGHKFEFPITDGRHVACHVGEM
jgi:hypothetical protein